MKKLYKSRYDVKIDGVCSGVANYIGVDATIVRLVWLIAFLAFGSGFLVYIICALLMPREPETIIDPRYGHNPYQNIPPYDTHENNNYNNRP